MKASLHEKENNTKYWQEGLWWVLLAWRPPLLCGCPLTQKEKEKALPRALAVSMTGHLNGSSPFILPSDHTVKPLLMSSAKMMLVRRAGWDRRA